MIAPKGDHSVVRAQSSGSSKANMKKLNKSHKDRHEDAMAVQKIISDNRYNRV